MSTLAPLPPGTDSQPRAGNPPSKKKWNILLPPSLSTQEKSRDLCANPVEQFYLQKQMQMKTPMVLVLDDGERIEGRIEWYDRLSLKVQGRTRTLVYKAAIKYMHKQGEVD